MHSGTLIISLSFDCIGLAMILAQHPKSNNEILLQNPLLLSKNELSEVLCHMAYTRAGRAQGRRFMINFDCFPKRVFFTQKGGVLQQNHNERLDPIFILLFVKMKPIML
jgi:hypothetical protein